MRSDAVGSLEPKRSEQGVLALSVCFEGAAALGVARDAMFVATINVIKTSCLSTVVYWVYAAYRQPPKRDRKKTRQRNGAG